MRGMFVFICPACLLDHCLTFRFRQIPSFRKGAICRFPPNVSEVCQCAARHFEDVLQVIIYHIIKYLWWTLLFVLVCNPCMWRIISFRAQQGCVQTLLFRLAQWHALAKLRLHTEHSLNHLDKASHLLGHQLCKFRDFTCSAFKTMELSSEASAWSWQRENKLTLAGSTSASAAATTAPQEKSFNLATYKLHTLGDYVRTIHLFGTTDSYTTQLVRWSVVIQGTSD